MGFVHGLVVSLLVAGTTFSSFAASPRQLARAIMRLGASAGARPSARILQESVQSSAFVNGLVSGSKVWSKLGGNRSAGDIFISVEGNPQFYFIRPVSMSSVSKYSHKSYVLGYSDDLMKLNSDIHSSSALKQLWALSDPSYLRGVNGVDYSVIRFKVKKEDLATLDVSEFNDILENLATARATARQATVPFDI